MNSQTDQRFFPKLISIPGVESINRATLQQRLRHLFLNLLCFNVCYLLGNALAHQQGVLRNIAFPFEESIPFLPWMIIPYLSSSVFFCLGFFWVHNTDQLRVFSHRLLLATVVAGLVFILYPLRFSWSKPAMESPLYAALFGFLSLVDKPYNQLPSLHVAFCLIFWQSLHVLLHSRFAKIILAIWLLLTAGATIFVYQHHLMDILAGACLGLLCIFLIKSGRKDPNVAFYYLITAVVIFLVGVLAWKSVLGGYLTASLLLVGYAYYRRNPDFLHKNKGRYPAWIWVLYAPYLIGYWLTWYVVKWKERSRPSINKLKENLWIGRRLSSVETKQLPPHCTIIDLANELSETAALRSHPYFYFPLLDLLEPPPDTIDQIVTTIENEIAAGRTVYLHCAMGYGRSILVANAYLGQTEK